MVANVVRKRRRRLERIERRAAELNERIAQIDKLLLDRGPFAPFDEFHYTLRLGRARLENELADLAIEVLKQPPRTSAP